METPQPNASDPDDLATALETAAIFAAKNDSAEAAHWVLRAAECARGHGDSARAEALTRSAADLAPSLDESPQLPTPPPRRVSVRPAPPSERARREPMNDSQPMLLVRPSSTPAATAPRPSSVPSATAQRSSSVPSVTTQRPSSVPAAAQRPSSRPLAATALAAKVETAPSTRDVLEESSVRRSSPSTAPAPKPTETSKPSPKPSARSTDHRFLRLQGARVSIAQSEASNRFYLVKVLDDDDPVPDGEQEAFLVLAHPR